MIPIAILRFHSILQDIVAKGQGAMAKLVSIPSSHYRSCICYMYQDMPGPLVSLSFSMTLLAFHRQEGEVTGSMAKTETKQEREREREDSSMQKYAIFFLWAFSLPSLDVYVLLNQKRSARGWSQLLSKTPTGKKGGKKQKPLQSSDFLCTWGSEICLAKPDLSDRIVHGEPESCYDWPSHIASLCQWNYSKFTVVIAGR